MLRLKSLYAPASSSMLRLKSCMLLWPQHQLKEQRRGPSLATCAGSLNSQSGAVPTPISPVTKSLRRSVPGNIFGRSFWMGGGTWRGARCSRGLKPAPAGAYVEAGCCCSHKCPSSLRSFLSETVWDKVWNWILNFFLVLGARVGVTEPL